MVFILGGGAAGGAGGGGSFDAGTNQILDAAFHKGDGVVRLIELTAAATASIDATSASSDPPGGGDPPAVPEPASAPLLGAALLGFAAIRRGTMRRR